MPAIATPTAAALSDHLPIRPLSDLSTADVPYAGGKGASLGQLTRAGLPVPPGFVVGAPAHAAFRAARQAVGDDEMPGWLADAIAAAYDELCRGEPDAPVAVRSSARAEETASTSSAGMNETFLNVRGRDQVLEAVKRCWLSQPSDMDIGVVVQRQIPSRRAGVMCTIDPVTGERDHLVVEGSFGPGASVVPDQRQSPSDRYVVEKGNMAIVMKQELGAERGHGAVLSDDELLRLAELGIAIEREYGAPQDTEWGLDPEDNIWMFHARPITVPHLDAPGVVTSTRLLVNLSEPSQVERVARLDVDGVGLVRAELMLMEALEGVHPDKLLAEGRSEELVRRLSAGLLTFAVGFEPRPVTYRTTDLRSSELDPFELELEAIERVWESGHTNLHVMLPVLRTTRELSRCRDLVAAAGLLDRPGFELWVTAEVPPTLLTLERYANIGIAGISIGPGDPAVTEQLTELIPRARAAGLQTSICGQAPSVHPGYAELLVRAGIDAISVTPDAVERTRRMISAAERRLLPEAARA